MKKTLVLILTLTLLLALGSVYASAEPLPEWIDPKLVDDALYMIGSEDDFKALGDIEIQWDPDAADKLDLADMSMQDWIDAEYEMTIIDASSMITWHGDASTYDEDWSIATYFVSDGEWLYIGFYVKDSSFTYGEADKGYNGDAFQICIDFGGKLGAVLDEDPYLLTNPKNIFYSFSCKEDGAPLDIVRQESEDNRHLTEANGDGVQGTAYATTAGWNAEFALSLEMLYDDYVFKAYENDPTIYVGGEDELPLTIGCCLYYMDRYYNEAEGEIKSHWIGGTSSGRVTDEEGNPLMTYTAYDNGINLYLPYQEGLNFACENLVVVDPEEGIPDGGYITTTEPVTTTAEPEDDTTTTEPVDDGTTTAPADNATTTAPADVDVNVNVGGCGSVIGVSAAAIVLVAAAAAFVCKKKD